MQLAIGEPIPLSVYWPNDDETFEFRATIVTRNPPSILASNVDLDPVVGSPGLFAIEIDSMPDAAFVDVYYSGHIEGQPEIIMTAKEVFSRAPQTTAIAYDSNPLIGIVAEA